MFNFLKNKHILILKINVLFYKLLNEITYQII